MQQIIVIHGGTTFKEYDAYLKFLSNKDIKLDRLTYKPSWRENLQESLGEEYQVLLPTMPNKTNARYNEWKLWFENISHVFTDDCIFIGHSMGAIFLAKYMSENTLLVRPKATILVAAPYDDESVEDLTEFKIEKLSDKLTEQAGRIIFFNGSDDPLISQADLKKYQDAVPSAEFHILAAPDHFVRPVFPELIDTIKEISTDY